LGEPEVIRLAVEHRENVVEGHDRPRIAASDITVIVLSAATLYCLPPCE